MHWVKRGKHRYLYYTVIKDGKTVREYHGTGPQAEIRYAQDQQRRKVQRERKAELQQQLDMAAAVGADVQQVDSWSDLLTRATLVAAGYYLHQRCEWRPRGDKRKRQDANT